MALEQQPIDISNRLELSQLVEELKRARRVGVLRRDNHDVAVLTPLADTPRPKRRPRGKRTSADDPLWSIVGMFHSNEPSIVSEHVDEFLAEWEVANNRP